MKISKIAVLLISGFAAGAITGLLMAPESGENTRKKIAKEGKKARKYAEKKAKEFRGKAEDMKGKVSEVKDNIEGAASDLKKRFS
jgi:gas vesicle protein